MWISCIRLAGVAVLASAFAPALAHWPDQAPHQFADLGAFEFEGGGKIPNLRMSYVTHGTLNAAKDNAVVFLHGFGSNHHGFDQMIGPGKPLDTDRYFVVCPDALGATQTAFEHSTSPTNSGLKMRFPAYSSRDMVNASHRLLTEALGIPRVLAITGLSMGAAHSIQFAVSHTDFMDGVLPVVGGALWGTQGYFWLPQVLSTIERCAGWEAGNYDRNPEGCAANAISAIVPYFYTREWWELHVDTPEAYQVWRNQWGEYYLDIQDARDLHYMAMSMALGWLGNTPGFGGDVFAALRSIKAKTLFVVNPQDQFLPPRHVETQVKTIPNASAVYVDSVAGHLICCNADPQATRAMGRAIRTFLEELSARTQARR
jgi:homoserine O-acetyltransferase